MTLIATEAGQYDLPAIEIPWWNTETDRQEVARLAPVTIDIMPNPGTTPGIQQPPSQISQSNQEEAIADDTSETISSNDRPAAASTTTDIHWLVWLFGIAWVLTLFAWWYSRRSNLHKPQQPTPIAEIEKVDPSKQAIAEALLQLEQAYAEKDAVAARSAWLAWAKLKWPESPQHNLTRLATRCDHAVSEAVQNLERNLYSPTDETGWADYEVRLLIQQMQQKRSADKHPEGLVPLNP
jgi:HAMP domain-containing protein